MNIVFMGTPEFAVPSLQTLLDHRFTVSAVVTAPDKPRGRGQQVSPTPVKEFAVASGIPVLQPETLRDPEFVSALQSLAPDLFVVVAFRILPKDVYTIPRLGAFNLHASLLPKYRGAAPINWAIINGETETGVTTFFLQEKVDTGSIILRKSIPIPSEMNAGELHDELMDLGARAVLETVQLIDRGSVPLLNQDDSLATPAPKIFKDDCRIDWTRSTAAVHNFIRGLSPYPAAWTTLEGKTVKIFRTHIMPDASSSVPPPVSHTDAALPHSGAIRTEEERLFAAASDGELEILELQLEGKKRLTAAEFLRGRRLTVPAWDN
ncbi:MAG TPA: methionyl-tRNA formyltransferase [Bacteroidota bacterium]|nr:methionyl-tRNA formyltransferase [Bacteroidota bacterium]